MHEGIYESLVTQALSRQLGTLADIERSFRTVDEADQPEVLARHIAQVMVRALSDAKDTAARVRIVNDVLRQVSKPEQGLDDHVQQLTRLASRSRPGVASIGDTRPTTPLSDAGLLTNAHGEPSLGAELRAELESADAVDLLCAFVKWHGIRVLEPELRRLAERGVRLRVVTTTYMGATERSALDRLVREFGAEVKIQYDALRTRLHAKAWLFRRDTGFDTAYVGSSNLSRSALLEGVEWNVRLSRVATASLLQKFEATFDTYWNDATFESYDPDRDRDRLDDALAEASGRREHNRVTLTLSGLEVRPYPYQQEMLESLDVERTVHDRHRNLVVAATGTGKTVIAALDYRGLCNDETADRPSLLFVAHRREILEQSLRTYREVLADASFGELYVGGARPERWRHVFASVQSLTAYGVDNIPADAYDIVVIDEFHHAQAATYRRLIDHLAPRELVGLTATPERADGVDVRAFFDGRTAAELRLWEALSADLLCPFHYFGVADGTDLRSVTWRQGRYDDAALSNVYTRNDARAAIVLSQLRDKVMNLGRMRALGFCVDVAHAEFMAAVFTRAGVPARAVSGRTPQAARERALDDLRTRRVNVLFAADLFNEGLDLPDVDTVLFLRPTESATVFLQQLGRGLRRSRDKAVLTALDFVGHHRKEFRFDVRYRALTGATKGGLERQIEQGFPFLPSGCQIVLDEQAQAAVLGTSARRSPTVGRTWWPSCVRTASRRSRRSCRSPESTSPMCSDAVSVPGRPCSGPPVCPPAKAQRSRIDCSSASAPSHTSMIGHVPRATSVCSRTTRLRTRASPRQNRPSPACCSSASGPAAVASVRTRTGYSGYALSMPCVTSSPRSWTSPSTRPGTEDWTSPDRSAAFPCGFTLGTSARRCWPPSTTPATRVARTASARACCTSPRRTSTRSS